jgi:hypothetical protein
MSQILDPTIPAKAADDFESGALEWTTGWGDRKKRTCLHGALLRPCEHPGDAVLWSMWATRQGKTMEWNDRSTDQTPIVAALRALPEPTETNMAEWFGPQWQPIVDLVRSIATLDMGQIERLAAAWDAARYAARYAARAAALDAAWDAARYAARYAALDAARAAARDAARDAARYAAWALTVRDLIGTHGFTQDHYNLLTGPWATTIGRVHPDDPDRLIR